MRSPCLWRVRHLPAQAQEPVALAQATPALADRGAPACGDGVREARAYVPPRSGTAPGPQRVSGAFVGVGAGVGVGAVPPPQLAPTHVYPLPYAPTSPPSLAAALAGEPDCKRKSFRGLTKCGFPMKFGDPIVDCGSLSV